MSAFMCSDDHIRVLAIAATHGVGGGAVVEARQAARGDDPRDGWAARDAAQTLALANAYALHDRYGEAIDETGGLAITEGDVARLAVHLTPVIVAKLVACYQYQACEWASFEGSDAERLTWRALERAARCLPGYDNAPWGL